MLVASSCGTGVQVFPNLCAENGLILMLGWITMVWIGCYWSHYMLTQRARHYGVKTYAELADLASGKGLRFVLIISILSYLYAGALGG